ncbi:hypothetical protein D3C86_1043700 [compost metagenome]
MLTWLALILIFCCAKLPADTCIHIISTIKPVSFILKSKSLVMEHLPKCSKSRVFLILFGLRLLRWFNLFVLFTDDDPILLHFKGKRIR